MLAVFSVDLLDDGGCAAGIQGQIPSLGRQLHGGAEFVLLVHLVIGLGRGHADHVDIGLQAISDVPSTGLVLRHCLLIIQALLTRILNQTTCLLQITTINKALHLSDYKLSVYI